MTALGKIVPAEAGIVALTVNQEVKESSTADSGQVKLVQFESPPLSAFYGWPIYMRAGVALPPGFGADAIRQYAAVYSIHGFGGNHR